MLEWGDGRKYWQGTPGGCRNSGPGPSRWGWILYHWYCLEFLYMMIKKIQADLVLLFLFCSLPCISYCLNQGQTTLTASSQYTAKYLHSQIVWGEGQRCPDFYALCMKECILLYWHDLVNLIKTVFIHTALSPFLILTLYQLSVHLLISCKW